MTTLDLFDDLVKRHEEIAKALADRKDHDYAEQNKVLSEAEAIRADACRRAAKALRDRK